MNTDMSDIRTTVYMADGATVRSMTADEALTDMGLYRDGATMRAQLRRLTELATRGWRIMEVCGGQTFTLSRYRLEELLPAGITMIHGPGCPVCVTPASTVDEAIELAMRPGVTVCSFGDMIRVPGTVRHDSPGAITSLLRARAAGADVRVLYSPLEALTIARDNPSREVVFFAIGFETTTPVYALLAEAAARGGVKNLSLLTSLFTVPAAVRAVVDDPESRVDALLAAGHVCAVTGLDDYHILASDLRMPVVVTGFEPVDMLAGILCAAEMLERGETGVVNAYGRVVSPEGSPRAVEAIRRVFEPCNSQWRGMGEISGGGMRLRPEFEQFDARKRFNLTTPIPSSLSSVPSSDTSSDGHRCLAPSIMKGLCSPSSCGAFGRECTPDHPVGAPMVSSEGVCAAHYRYLRN